MRDTLLTDSGAAKRQEPHEQRLLKPHEISEILQVHEVTLRRWAASGRIPSLKIGGIRRYRLGDVLASLEGGEL